MKKSLKYGCLFLGAGLVIGLCLSPFMVKADVKPGLTDAELALLRIRQFARKVKTAEFDMRLFTLDKERRFEGDNWAVGQLLALDHLAAHIVVPPETEQLRSLLRKMIGSLGNVADVAPDDYEALSTAIQEYFKTRDAFAKQLHYDFAALWRDSEDDLPDTLQVEANSIADEEARARFLRAYELIKDHAYQQALALLAPLLVEVGGLMAEGRVVEMILQCHMVQRSPISDGYKNYEKIETLVYDYLMRKASSPRIPVLYFYWQTLQQVNNNGFSNFSTIDYKLHHRVFDELMDVIIDAIQANPDDTWMRAVPWILFSYPPIERFPENYYFGNSVALHRAHLIRFFDGESNGEVNDSE